MAHISRSIDVPGHVDAITERWAEFERLPRRGGASAAARVRWRAEVLTFEPRDDRTRVTLRISYDPAGGDAGLAQGIEEALQAFESFVASHGTGAALWPGLAVAGAKA